VSTTEDVRILFLFLHFYFPERDLGISRKRMMPIPAMRMAWKQEERGLQRNRLSRVCRLFDLDFAAEGDVSPHRKRLGAVKREPSGNNDVAGNCAQIVKGVHATKKDVGSKDAQVTDHCESHEGMTATGAASHPMNLHSEHTS
jgi:hypothetical protein